MTISVFVSVRGGLTLDEGIYIAQIVAQTGDCYALHHVAFPLRS